MEEWRAHARFPTTRWSRVIAAGDAAGPGATEALAELCQAYWFPDYAYIRRKGHGPEQAADLAQSYFTRLLERRTLAAADPRKGRFRAFLIADCAFFLADSRDREAARKRGGHLRFIPIEAEGRSLRSGRFERRTPSQMMPPTGWREVGQPGWLAHFDGCLSNAPASRAEPEWGRSAGHVLDFLILIGSTAEKSPPGWRSPVGN